jgi:hypothetical protein
VSLSLFSYHRLRANAVRLSCYRELHSALSKGSRSFLCGSLASCSRAEEGHGISNAQLLAWKGLAIDSLNAHSREAEECLAKAVRCLPANLLDLASRGWFDAACYLISQAAVDHVRWLL